MFVAPAIRGAVRAQGGRPLRAPYVDASAIEVTVVNGEVTLIGVVSERPQKRMAEDAAEDVSGVREVTTSCA